MSAKPLRRVPWSYEDIKKNIVDQVVNNRKKRQSTGDSSQSTQGSAKRKPFFGKKQKKVVKVYKVPECYTMPINGVTTMLGDLTRRSHTLIVSCSHSSYHKLRGGSHADLVSRRGNLSIEAYPAQVKISRIKMELVTFANADGEVKPTVSPPISPVKTDKSEKHDDGKKSPIQMKKNEMIKVEEMEVESHKEAEEDSEPRIDDDRTGADGTVTHLRDLMIDMDPPPPLDHIVFRPVGDRWMNEKCILLGLQRDKFGSRRDFVHIREQSELIKVTEAPDRKNIVEIDGDGNSLFRALSWWITGSDDEHLELRRTIITFLLEFPDEFGEKMSGNAGQKCTMETNGKQAYDDYKIVMKSEAISEEEPEEAHVNFLFGSVSQQIYDGKAREYCSRMISLRREEEDAKREEEKVATVLGVDIYVFSEGRWERYRPLFEWSAVDRLEVTRVIREDERTRYGLYLSNDGNMHYDVVFKNESCGKRVRMDEGKEKISTQIHSLFNRPEINYEETKRRLEEVARDVSKLDIRQKEELHFIFHSLIHEKKE